jgi:hypothetical protein
MKKVILAAMVALLVLPTPESQAQRAKVVIAVVSLVAGIIAGSTQAAKADQPSKPAPAPKEPDLVAGKIYKLVGPGWRTTAQYCVNNAPGLCLACDPDWSHNLCVIRASEPALDISQATIN